MDRRTFLRAGAAGVAAAALGGGLWVQRRRQQAALASEPITGPWEALGPGAQWLLPSLDRARMVVPDRPHDVAEARDPARRGGVRRTRTFHVTTSARRLRGDTHGEAPAPGALRVAAVGDSVTFGWGVAEAESLPARVEAALRAAGRAVEVLNAGVPAQRLETMRAWLQQEAPRLGVGAVLFIRRPYPQGGDPLGAYAREVRLAAAALPGARFLVLLPPVSRFDPRGGAAAEGEARGLAERLAPVPVLDLTAAMREAQGARGWGLQTGGGAWRMVELATGEVAAEAAPVAQGLPPAFYEVFEARREVREALFFDDGHPDAEGFEALGRAVAARVLAEGWPA